MDGLGSSFAPVKQLRAFEGVVVQIENAIIEGRLKAGDRLPPERELAEIFQVSRASIREALRVLETLGVVNSRRGTGADSGCIVSSWHESPLSSLLRLHAALLETPLSDLLDVREAVEIFAARKATERASEDDIERLRSILASMRETYTPEELLPLDTDFHVAVAKASGNSVVPLIMGALRDAIARQGLRAFKVLEESGKWESERKWLLREHAGLLETIERRDPDAAADAFSHHVRDFYNRVLADQPAAGQAPAATPIRKSSRRRPA